MLNILLQVPVSAGIADSMAHAATAISNTAPTEQSVPLWEIVQKGGPILIPIALLSLAAIYIFFERFFTIKRFSKIDFNFMNQIRDFVHHGNIDAARSLCRNTNSPVARMIEKGVMRLGKPVREIES